ncbi:GNAT family N-acetyltransferase [Paenibacillus sp. KQZ6P-2]|uniref:GNAT family N-acetyltransferase n=1 Tax=Paenibacillus mangrovi TaxID=2931978 RepID=A0A9X1WKC3_9BACL|nr:GNAT family N-acetyltransferase [Paenibacillus mangrovi]MCJ8010479.1 GNAT family N-acetyltransferase [Paenibacillus mangrovi]
MKASVIRNMEELHQWERPWKELIQHMENAEVYDTWDWLESYLNHMFNKDHQLFIVVVTNQDQCIAIVPLCIAKQKMKWFTVKSLQFIVSGTGESGSFFLHKEYNYSRLVQEISDLLRLHQKEWDWINLYNIHSLHPATGLIQQAFGEWSEVYARPRSYSPYINLELYNQHKLAGSRIKAIERKERKLRREHEAELKIHVQCDDRIWNRFTELHKLRWEHSLFGDQGTESFYKDIIPKFHRVDQTHFSYLEIDGSMASACMTFICNDKLYLYLAAFSKQYAEYGAGLILVNRMMEYYTQQGIKEIDFMSGTQDYKFIWSDTVRLHYHIRLVSRDRGNKLRRAYTLLQMNKDNIKSLFSKKSSTG